MLTTFWGLNSYSQTLPSARYVNWSSAGSHTFYEPETVFNFADFGGFTDGETANDAVMEQLLNEIPETGAVIYFSAGDYLFHESIDLPAQVILRGESASLSKLTFDLNEETDLIAARGSSTGISSNLTVDAHKNQIFLEVTSSAAFLPGDYIRISETDESLITSSWALHSIAEIARITAIEGETIIIDHPLRKDFSVEHAALIRKLEPIENVGIEQLLIERLDQTDWQTSNILFEYAANCRVSCVESINCNFAHVDIRNSTHLKISGSYFHHAFDYGGGGKAYGVVLHSSSGMNLVENNIFEHLRHSVLLQSGANGNVIGYNYSTDPFWSGVMLPANSAGDLVLHGNYPYANLFEGNTVQNIVIDNSHGINGPNNTFFRNRSELYGIVMNFGAGDQQNFIGNEITNSNFLMGNYLLTGANHYEYGNLVKGAVIPAGTEGLVETSLYKSEIPDYYLSQSAWPPIGDQALYNVQKIEAENRFHTGSFTACEEETVTVSAESVAFDELVVVYPNPATEFIRISTSSTQQIRSVEVTSETGQRVHYASGQEQLGVSHLPTGLYILKIRFEDESVVIKRWVKI